MEKQVNPSVLKRFRYSTDEIIDAPFNWPQLIRLFTYVKPYSRTLLPKAIIAVTITTLIRLLIPILIGVYVINKALENKDGQLLWILVGSIAVLFLINTVANRFRIRWMNEIGQNVILDLRKHLFTHVQWLSHRFFDRRSAGSILVRIMNDINSLQELFTNGIVNLLMDLLLLIGVLIILFTLSPPLALAVFIILPIMFFISTTLRKKIRRSWQDVRSKQSKINSHLNESIQGMRITQSFTQENENMAFFNGINEESYESWRVATKKNSMFRPFVEMTNAVGSVVLIVYGAYLIKNGNLDLGTFVAFAFYLGMFWEPISRLGMVYNQLLMGMASSERIFEFLDEQPLVNEKSNAKRVSHLKGHIEFEDVEFGYEKNRLALKGISLDMKAGETVALVGHTGSGKTTIASLVSRFYDPTSGVVKMDGMDIRDLSLSDLRGQISIVLQETFIFSGTIIENIRFGNPDATDEEVKTAAQAVGANHFIERLPNSYDTEVEERGNILSVGERQLLSFARAILANPRIIILDEATASIDTETELQIQVALRTLLKNRTAIMIAHRLSTIREASQIIVLEQGSVLESGNHDTLMKHRGHYHQLVMSQFQDE
ncbi:ABC transporter ATP-binding protein [Paenisporosarcina sp. TG20]|uniref:ABC transporter ATP-binding protein n=1 Tax=Paenisporosarcina sp. TG20 TaxID=1211706 RepID=UPI0002EC9427|nr:ABC transporter ATP-binding protein [Paenisporosarcina sp. TG20]